MGRYLSHLKKRGCTGLIYFIGSALGKYLHTRGKLLCCFLSPISAVNDIIYLREHLQKSNQTPTII